MPLHTETDEFTPKRVASVAQQIAEIARKLEQVSTQMEQLDIDGMTFPRGNSYSVGFRSLETFAIEAEKAVGRVGTEIKAGLSVEDAVEKVLSEYRRPKRKTAKKRPTMSTNKKGADKRTRRAKAVR